MEKMKTPIVFATVAFSVFFIKKISRQWRALDERDWGKPRTKLILYTGEYKSVRYISYVK